MPHRNIENISILNREGKPVDITQAMCKLCVRVMPLKKSQMPVNYSLQKLKVKPD